METKPAVLHQKFPEFTYQKFEWQLVSNRVIFKFYYTLSQNLHFRHQLSIPCLDSQPNSSSLDTLALYLGMVEMFNYWKLSASLNIKIQAGHVSAQTLTFFQNLLTQGMGEYFYTNRLDPHMEISWHVVTASTQVSPLPSPTKLTDIPIVMVGGGKDSAVTMGSLDQNKLPYHTLTVNPTAAADESVRVSQSTSHLTVERTLDPQLIILNQQNFFNGHIPFSAVLSFIGYTVAYLNNSPFVIVSNESSADEANIDYRGQAINHQYSKTSTYERQFRHFSHTHLHPSIEYFSYIRPLSELRVASVFAKYKQYHSVFLSCNVGSKTNTWCGQCPKCLFTYLMLAPFIEESELIQIFGSNLLQNQHLLPIAKQLIDEKLVKPLECVGTREEVAVAFYLIHEKYSPDPPYIIKSLVPQYLSANVNWQKRAQKLVSDWSTNHFLPEKYEHALKKSLV